MHDYSTLDGIFEVFYEGVSGPPGFEWDRERQRSLYLPGALLVRLSTGDGGEPKAEAMDPDGHMDGTAEYLASTGFYETEVKRETRRFGNMAHVWSAYEARHAPDDPEPFKRGVNSVQLYWDGERWWIAAAMWDNERPGE